MMMLRMTSVFAISVSVLLAFAGFPTCSAMMMGKETVEEAIRRMEERGSITRVQANTVLEYLEDDAGLLTESHTSLVRGGTSSVMSSKLKRYFEAEVSADAMSDDASYSILNMLDLVKENVRYNPSPVSDEDNIVRLLGRWQAPNEDSFRNYNGIWGYSARNGREYALSCNSLGLNIVDITFPRYPVLTQFIAMPGGDVWRDVATHRDLQTGETYAYVAGQTRNGAEADLWVVNLSFLPDQIPPEVGYKPVPGYREDGHTLNVDGGYLFLNTAEGEIKILDLLPDPYNPNMIAEWRGGDGHDSHYVEGVIVPSTGRFTPRQILITSDGNDSRVRFVDISDIRDIYQETGAVVEIFSSSSMVLGETDRESGTYQHSSAITMNRNYVYLCEESNEYDIAIFDIRDMTSPIRIGDFQWSGETPSTNSIVHNARVRGNLLHVAYYTAGYRVFDISEPTRPVEVGFYNTLCEGDEDCSGLWGKFNGAWNVYTELRSGNILVNDSVNGLFIFSINKRGYFGGRAGGD